jgi:cobalamin biosynthesis Mg chelatase CobN
VITMPAQLTHLAQAYFHQDYDLEFSGPDAVIAAFVEGEQQGAVRELVSEIDTMLASRSSESQIADLWVKALGAAYDPTVDGQSYRGWFTHVRDLLSRRC